MTSFAEVESQSAFVGLLTTPIVTASSNPELHRLVRRHQRVLSTWATKCGYRLITVGEAARLHRTPINGSVTVPDRSTPPSRRQLVLTLAAAAACEEAESTTTVQAVSDAVRDITAVSHIPVGPYDPDLRHERLALVRALERLETYGVLRRRTYDEQLLKTWEDGHQGVGRGYEIDRYALLQLVDPATVASVFATPSDHVVVSESHQRVLRILVETQALLYAELTPDDAEWARTKRAKLVEDAVRMTGGIVESRSEGIVLTLRPERSTSPAATVDWPRPTTAAWVALLLADSAMKRGQDEGLIGDDGVCRISSAEVDHLAHDLHHERRRHLTKDLADNPGLLRSSAEETLRDVGTLRITAQGDWHLRPTAARYRNPNVVVGEPHQGAML